MIACGNLTAKEKEGSRRRMTKSTTSIRNATPTHPAPHPGHLGVHPVSSNSGPRSFDRLRHPRCKRTEIKQERPFLQPPLKIPPSNPRPTPHRDHLGVHSDSSNGGPRSLDRLGQPRCEGRGKKMNAYQEARYKRHEHIRTRGGIRQPRTPHTLHTSNLGDCPTDLPTGQ